jgi:hypothetical protein
MTLLAVSACKGADGGAKTENPQGEGGFTPAGAALFRPVYGKEYALDGRIRNFRTLNPFH